MVRLRPVSVSTSTWPLTVQSEVPRQVAVYAFQGEFWNDELDDYEVILPDKCQKAEEWDIFFK